MSTSTSTIQIEQDDAFEEFETEGKYRFHSHAGVDWDTQNALDLHQWEDAWDDDVLLLF